MKAILIFITMFSISNMVTYAQPQWKFHVAFEDATGQKDTIWMIYDTTANIQLPVDTNLGEGPTQLSHNDFNVYTLNADGDSTKTSAIPYIYYPTHYVEIFGMNYQYPIIISWDTSLFHSSILPASPNSYINNAFIDNQYYFFVNNDPIGHVFNMIIENFALAPSFSWGTMSQFPMSITLGYVNGVYINKMPKKINLVYPNVTNGTFYFHNVDNKVQSIELYNMLGKKVEQILLDDNLVSIIDLGNLPKGAYLLLFNFRMKNFQNQIYYEKIIKM